MNKPVLRHIANLWTLMQHPSPEAEWGLEQKLDAIKEAGFDGVYWTPSEELHAGVERFGLIFLGATASEDASAFPALLRDMKRYGAVHVNVQLASDETSAPVALQLAMELMREAKELGLRPAIETHRGTCTETPEKMYALTDAYRQATGETLPISWDFSHFAVVKHLMPENFSERLLLRPEHVQRSQQFHLRPFNGHHAQVPVTARDGELSPEMRDWMPFAQAVLQCWVEGNRETGREIFVCPELGPITGGGYGLSAFQNSWEDAKIVRREIDGMWNKLNT